MTKRILMSFVLKILAVIFIAYGISTIPAIFFWLSVCFSMEIDPMSGYLRYVYLSFSITQPLLFFLFALVLIKWSDYIARKLIIDDSVMSGLSVNEWEIQFFKLALRIIGVICVVFGLSKCVKNASELGLMSWWGRPVEWSEIITGLLLIFIGIYFLSGGKKIVALAFRVRHKKKS